MRTKKMPKEIKIKGTERHNKFAGKVPILSTEEKKTIQNAITAKTEKWENAAKFENFGDTGKPTWEVGPHNEIFASIIFQGKKAIMIPDPEENRISLDIMQGIVYRTELPESPIFQGRQKIYIGKIVRDELNMEKKSPSPKLKVKKLIKVEKKKERKQIRMNVINRLPQKEDEFAIDYKSGFLIFQNNRRAELFKKVLEEKTAVEWYTGINHNTLVLLGGATEDDLNNAARTMITTDIFI